MYVLEMPGISMAAKLVACGHAAHVGRERFAQELPNISKLARELGMTRSTVRRAVRDLVAADVLDGE
jgi:DNA-binding FadR family transcriptional regulator